MPQGRNRARLLPLLAASLLVVVAAGAIGGLSPAGVASAAAVAWPPSTDLLIGELVTGGVTSNDEYVEIYNAGPIPADLGGLELVYVTATGTTVTRKATWTSRIVAPGRHLLVANSVGSFTTLADDVYIGGFAATGGVVALRVIGGTVVDAIGWGTAANAFVEGMVAPAPPAGQSLERLPGGSSGNTRDTNDNLSDTWVQAFPVPESSAAPAVPAASPTPSTPPSGSPSASLAVATSSAAPVTSTPVPTVQPTATGSQAPIATEAPTQSFGVDPTPVPTTVAAPTPLPSATPTPFPSPTQTLTPTASPTPIPTPTASPTPPPTPTHSPSPTATATPSPTHSPSPTTSPSPTPGPSPSPTHTASPTPTPSPTPAPTPTRSPSPTPTPAPTATARPTATPSPAPELVPIPISVARRLAEDSVVTVAGTVNVDPGQILGDRVVAIQDDSGGICVRFPSDADLSALATGDLIRVTGKLTSPYANLEVRLAQATDSTVLGSGPESEAIDGWTSSLSEETEGQLLRLSGSLIRIETGSNGALALILTDQGTDARVYFHAPLAASRGDFRLGSTYAATGIVGQRESASGLNDGFRLWPRDLADVVEVAPEPTPTPAPDSTQIPGLTQSPGQTPTPGPAVTPRPTATPGSTATPRPTATPRATATPRPTATPHATGTPVPTATPRETPTPAPTASSAPRVSIAAALERPGDNVTVEGVVTTPTGLLDADGRRVTIEDAGAAILLRLPASDGVPALGTRVRVAGLVGTYYGAPQLEADGTAIELRHDSASPVLLRRAPGAADEWRLVRMTVQIVNVSKNGDTWRAEVSLGAGGSLPVAGIASSGIASTALVEGRNASLTGIVKRAYPTASDQRYALVPRSPADIQLGADPSASQVPGATEGPSTTSTSPGTASGPGGTDHVPPSGSVTDTQATQPSNGEPGVVLTTIDGLASLVGQRVRVAGRVLSVNGPTAALSDGTGETVLRFVSAGDASAVGLLADDVVNVVGWDAESDLGGLEVVVTAATDVTRAPSLGAGAPPLGSGDAHPSSQSPTASGPSTNSQPGSNGSRMASVAAGLLAGSAAAGLMLLAGVAAFVRRRRRGLHPTPAPAPPSTPPPTSQSPANAEGHAAVSGLVGAGSGNEERPPTAA
jgi:hypothetical protein